MTVLGLSTSRELQPIAQRSTLRSYGQPTAAACCFNRCNVGQELFVWMRWRLGLKYFFPILASAELFFLGRGGGNCSGHHH